MIPTLTKEDWEIITRSLEETYNKYGGEAFIDRGLFDKIGPEGKNMLNLPLVWRKVQPNKGEYRVVWEIDLSANSPIEAAKEAFKAMQEKGTEATYFTVIDSEGKSEDIDLQNIEWEEDHG